MEERFEKVIREIICGDSNKRPRFVVSSEERLLAKNEFTGDCVFVGTTERENKRVIKQISFLSKKSGRSVRQTKNEIKHLRQIEHDAVITLIDDWNDDHNVYIMFPYYEQDLFSWMDQKQNGCESEELYVLYSRIISALEYIHHMRIWHMDIKPENILVKKNNLNSVVLTDFGSSISENNLSCGMYRGCVGSAGFASPEVFEKKPYYPGPCDYWSLGCTLVEMMWGWESFEMWVNCYKERSGTLDLSVPLECFKQTTKESSMRTCIVQLLSASPYNRCCLKEDLPFEDVDPRRLEDVRTHGRLFGGVFKASTGETKISPIISFRTLPELT